MTLTGLINIARSRPNLPRFLASRILLRTGACRLLTIARDGYRLRFFPSSMSVALWELGPHARDGEEALIRGLLRPGDTVIDVGANIGAVALFAKSVVGDTGHVLAVEPQPRIFGYLEENVRLNRAKIEAYCMAAGRKHDTLHLSDGGQDDQNNVISSGGIQVPAVPLDEIARNLGSVRLLKVDVEGYELEVLRGARRVLARTEYIYIECWDEHFARAGCTASELLKEIADAGFTVIDLEGHIVTPRPFPTCENLVAWNPALVERPTLPQGSGGPA